jgi:hypothetical protein
MKVQPMFLLNDWYEAITEISKNKIKKVGE